jgi:hypothetical protein
MSQNITLTFLECLLDLFDDFTFLYFFFIIFLILILSNINKCSLELLDLLKHRIFIKHSIECLSLYIMLSTKCIIQPS